MRNKLLILLILLTGCAAMKDTAKATNPACLLICKAEVIVSPSKEKEDAP